MPRVVNQLALQALIRAAVTGMDPIAADAMKRVLHGHPLYTSRGTSG